MTIVWSRTRFCQVADERPLRCLWTPSSPSFDEATSVTLQGPCPVTLGVDEHWPHVFCASPASPSTRVGTRHGVGLCCLRKTLSHEQFCAKLRVLEAMRRGTGWRVGAERIGAGERALLSLCVLVREDAVQYWPSTTVEELSITTTNARDLHSQTYDDPGGSDCAVCDAVRQRTHRRHRAVVTARPDANVRWS